MDRRGYLLGAMGLTGALAGCAEFAETAEEERSAFETAVRESELDGEIRSLEADRSFLGATRWILSYSRSFNNRDPTTVVREDIQVIVPLYVEYAPSVDHVGLDGIAYDATTEERRTEFRVETDGVESVRDEAMTMAELIELVERTIEPV